MMATVESFLFVQFHRQQPDVNTRILEAEAYNDSRAFHQIAELNGYKIVKRKKRLKKRK